MSMIVELNGHHEIGPRRNIANSNAAPVRAVIAGGLIAFATVLTVGAVSMREPIADVTTSNLLPRISGN